MPNAALFLSFVQGVTILGSALTVLKFVTTGLYRRYRVFFAYFVFRVPYQATSLILRNVPGGFQSKLYLDLFIWGEPVVILLYILVVLELYGLVLEKYKGLYTIGRWAMYVSVVVAVVVSLLSLLPKIAPSTPEPSKRVIYEVAIERGVQLALVIFILLIVFFLSRYPVPLSRNVVVHTAIYSVFFLSETFVLLLRTLFGWNSNDTFNVILASITAACSVAWWLLISAKGEEVQVNVPHLRPDAEERILHQLDALNATLLKVSRK